MAERPDDPQTTPDPVGESPEPPDAPATPGVEADAPSTEGYALAEDPDAAVDGIGGDEGEPVEVVTPPMEAMPEEVGLAAGAQAGSSRRAVWAWVGLWLAVAALVALRAAQLAWLSPLALAADEAQYWDWSRHPALTYVTKGPGIAWVIGGARWLAVERFHVELAEWVVRLGSVLSWGVLVAGVAWLGGVRVRPAADDAVGSWEGARRSVGGFRGAWYAMWLAVLTPVLWALGQFATIDMPMLACWVVGAIAAWVALAGTLRDEDEDPTDAVVRRQPTWVNAAAWAALGLAIGCGVLLKHTALLLVPGVVIACVWSAPRLRWGRVLRGWVIAVIALVAAMSPMLIGELQAGWPTVRHLMGHLGMAGGDIAIDEAATTRGVWSSVWSVLVYVGTQLAIVGPAWALIGLGAWGDGRDSDHDRSAAFGRLMLTLGALPVLMYLGVAWVTDTEANWAVAGYPTLVVLAGRALPARLTAWRRAVTRWRAMPADDRPKRGWLRRKPESPGQMMWHWTLGYGLVAIVALTLGGWLLRVPGVGDRLPGAGRVVGHADAAARIDGVIDPDAGLARWTNDPPIVITSNYGNTALLAFYLDGRPTVYSGQAALAGRRSAYDALPSTDLDDPALHGRDAVLVGASAKRWGDVLEAESIEEVSDTAWAEPLSEAEAGLRQPRRVEVSQLWGEPVFVARGYRGLSDVGRRNRAGEHGKAKDTSSDEVDEGNATTPQQGSQQATPQPPTDGTPASPAAPPSAPPVETTPADAPQEAE
ncbi:MAG: phospholipid carrier-dependent glycosyltransferase [Planctomycetota bacterium]